MVPLLLHEGYTPSQMLLITPIYFALAHVHHFRNHGNIAEVCMYHLNYNANWLIKRYYSCAARVHECLRIVVDVHVHSHWQHYWTHSVALFLQLHWISSIRRSSRELQADCTIRAWCSHVLRSVSTAHQPRASRVCVLQSRIFERHSHLVVVILCIIKNMRHKQHKWFDVL